MGRKKASEACNYRVTHHTINVFFEITRGKIAAPLYSEHGPGIEETYIGAMAGAITKALHPNHLGKYRRHSDGNTTRRRRY